MHRTNVLVLASLSIAAITRLALASAATPAPPVPPAPAPQSPQEVRAVVSRTLSEAQSPYEPDAQRFLASLDAGTSPGAPSGSTPAPGGSPQDAPHPGDDTNSLAVKLQNPVADLISVPIQFNWDTGIGPDDDKDKITVNIQPVIPFNLNEDWNLISRTIVPVIYEEAPVPTVDDAFGLGDTTQSFFFSPVKPIGGWILGVGLAALLPTGTDDLFRTKQFALGPTFVALKQDPVGEGTLTYGILANQLWKVAGSNEPDVQNVNSLYLQPFIGYTLKTGSTFTLNTESTYNWSNSEWSVPLNLMFSQLMRIGKLPVQLQFGGRYYVETVPNGPEWGIRFTFTFLFPK